MSHTAYGPARAGIFLAAAISLIAVALQTSCYASSDARLTSFPGYSVTYLGGVDSTQGSISTINMLGDGVGSVENGSGGYETFLRSDGNIDDISSQVGSSSQVTAINDYGTLAGVLLSGGSSYPFTYSDGQFTQLQGPANSFYNVAAINDLNQTAGYIFGPISLDNYREDAVVWQPNGTYVDLFLWPGIPPIPPDFEYSYATDVNYLGTVVGSANGYAIRWSKGKSYPLVDGTGKPAFGATANGINFFGGICGSTDNSHGNPVATVWDPGTGPLVLGALNGTLDQSAAYSINDWGDVVGSAQVSRGAYAFRAFLYHDNQMVNLNKLIPEDSGVKLLSGQQITDSGQILCIGLRVGYPEVQYILLTPNGESVSG